jgi:hypothetical protein
MTPGGAGGVDDVMPVALAVAAAKAAVVSCFWAVVETAAAAAAGVNAAVLSRRTNRGGTDVRADVLDEFAAGVDVDAAAAVVSVAPVMASSGTPAVKAVPFLERRIGVVECGDVAVAAVDGAVVPAPCFGAEVAKVVDVKPVAAVVVAAAVSVLAVEVDAGAVAIVTALAAPAPSAETAISPVSWFCSNTKSILFCNGCFRRRRK